VRGLNVGAPVEFSGIPIGEVIDLKLEYDMDTTRLRIPVVIDIQPGANPQSARGARRRPRAE
jgi:paraquat-inducible protein B